MPFNWFDEKQRQVIPSCINVFGIELDSRYGKAHEIAEMLKFAALCVRENVNECVTRVFYDSKACICSIKLDKFTDARSKNGRVVFSLAEKSFTQFEWGGAAFSKHDVDLIDLGGNVVLFDSQRKPA